MDGGEDKKKENLSKKGKIFMKGTLYMETHGNSGNDYPHGNKHKEGNNWKWKEVPVNLGCGPY